MNSMKINLFRNMFADVRRPLAEAGELKAEIFRYSTGIEAVRVSNRRGSFTVLPWMGQMIWRCDFDGRELVMKSIWDEPVPCKATFEESYGCFLMHCGLTAMGNPTPEDTHPGHGELPAAVYDEAWLEVGEDGEGPFMAVSGTYRHRRCYMHDYAFTPRALLRPGKAKVEVTATVVNNRDLPMEYYYLCHINHRPVDGSKIVESPLAKKPIINHEVPAGYYKPWGDATNRFLDALDRDYRLQSTIGAKGESYRPEIVNCYFHKPDAKGWAIVKQVYPKKAGGVFVRYRPKELPYATRWLCRTPHDDALGMCLPATAEHKGRLYCQAHKEQRYLAPGKSFSAHIETGILP